MNPLWPVVALLVGVVWGIVGTDYLGLTPHWTLAVLAIAGGVCFVVLITKLIVDLRRDYREHGGWR